MTDEHLINIETKLAHQEHTVAELNDALSSQQAQIIALESQVRALTERIRAMSEATPGAGEDNEPPPHY